MKLWRDETGQAAAIAVLLLPVMVVLMAVVLDSGLAVKDEFELQGAVDAAALAATSAYDQALWNSSCKVSINQSQAQTVASQYLQDNLPGASLDSVTVYNASDGSKATVTVNASYTGNLLIPAVLGKNQVTVTSQTRSAMTNAGCTS